MNPTLPSAAAGDSAAHRPRKRFGQHFLHDQTVIDRIIRYVGPRADDVMVEIGPGLGALTAPLIDRLDALTVVELDRDLAATLRARYPSLTVIQEDALRVDFGALAPTGGMLRVVGNLPYNISTPLLFHLLEFADRIADLHFMLQKEVVDRMVAGPGEDAYGRLSVAIAARADAERLFVVGSGAFRPPPKVESAVVRIVPRPPAFVVNDWDVFDRVVARAFGQRRKQLANTLTGVLNAGQIAALGIDPRARPETLTAAAFASLSNQLSRID